MGPLTLVSMIAGSNVMTMDEVTASVLDANGSYRDINFDAPSWNGVNDFCSWFTGAYRITSASAGDGREIANQLMLGEAASTLLGKPDGFLQVVGESPTSLIRALQLFVAMETTGEAFVELSFFPQDVDKSTFRLQDFLDLVERFRAILGSSRFYVRYENVSWELGDTSQRSGVIYVSDAPPPSQTESI